jgi:hypothetical protein
MHRRATCATLLTGLIHINGSAAIGFYARAPLVLLGKLLEGRSHVSSQQHRLEPPIRVHAKAGSQPGTAEIIAALDGGTQYSINVIVD